VPPPAPPIPVEPVEAQSATPNFKEMPKADVVRWWINQEPANRASLTGPYIETGVFRDTGVQVSTKTCTSVRSEFK
jgi:hypothetical protein